MICLRVFFGMPYMITSEVLIVVGVCLTVLHDATPALTARCWTTGALTLCAIDRDIQTVALGLRHRAFGKLHDAIMDDWHGTGAGVYRLRARTAGLVACYSCGAVSHRTGLGGASALAEPACAVRFTEVARRSELGRLVRHFTRALPARLSLTDALCESIPYG